MNSYKILPDDRKPRILGLTTGLLGDELQPDRLEAELLRLEKLLDSSVDTSSEIVTLIRLSCRPQETLIESGTLSPCTLVESIKMIVHNTKGFLNEHRYDPSEIYDEEFLDELKEIPNPKVVPLQLLDDFLDILDDMGPYCADKAALNILSKIEKLKVKVPYERHYLLLCLTSTTLVTIRSACDNEFGDLGELEKIKQYSTSKVLKFIEVIKQFKPPGEKPEVTEVEKVDEPPNSPSKGRGANRKGPRRNYFPRQQNDDILCALVFVHSRYKAKALFALLCVSNFILNPCFSEMRNWLCALLFQ